MAVIGKGAQSADADDQKKYERSSIKFPYGDLDDAISVASAIHSSYGTKCTTDQLAAALNQTVTSGAFRIKMATAGVFGLTDNSSGEISLTEIGRQVMDPAKSRAAKASSFLEVPLYKAIYDKYRGHPLPPAAALEREMSSLGVSVKQVAKARQAFERSAETAGFFAQGRTRLVMPSGIDSAPQAKAADKESVDKAQPAPKVNGFGGGSGGGGELDHLDPLLMAILRKIPSAQDGWDADKRVRWFKTFAMNVSQVYDGDNPVELNIAIADKQL
ncbi:MAG TPA: hypothetical protein VFB36_03215 [Nevskiaceae bacterium]|nr:hypothetical protein [Nevskiaceae bacterium]